jgi:hypothetical protein
MTMADKIKKSNTVIPPDDAARERASEKEHNKSTSPTSYRLPPDTLAQIEALASTRASGKAVFLPPQILLRRSSARPTKR